MSDQSKPRDPVFIVTLWLDGYESHEEMEKACEEYIYDQLNMTASSVKIQKATPKTLAAEEMFETLKKVHAWMDDRLCTDENGVNKASFQEPVPEEFEMATEVIRKARGE